MASPQTGHGVEALVERLRAEGIEAGRQEASRLLQEARLQIETERLHASAEADRLLAQAREQLRVEREAALSAIQLAARDALLRLKEDFLHQFATRLGRRVQGSLEDPTLLRSLLLNLLQSTDDGPPPPGQAQWDRLAEGQMAGMLREGIELLQPPGQLGFALRLSGEDIEVQVTDEAIEALLLEHLLPSVRRTLDGGAP